MISLREIADNKSDISSTRWAFAVSLRFAMVVACGSIIAFVICHLLKKPLDSSFLYAVGALLGVVIGFCTGAKALQGFEKQPQDMNNKFDEVEGGK